MIPLPSKMSETVKRTLCILIFIFHRSNGTIDINLAEYQYIADHLTQEECHQLVAALHFRSFDLPKEINAAERRLPEDVPCIDLLLHWNSTPREGKGQTHVEVCHRLNQIGRDDLAQWLSKKVFKEITKDLKSSFECEYTEDTTQSPSNFTECEAEEKTVDEAAWWKMDSIMLVLIVLGVASLIFGVFFLLFLCCTRKCKEKQGYVNVSTQEN